MHRVSKINGKYSVITYGGPDIRLKMMLDSLKKGTFELQIKEIKLSFMSNLINSLRSKSKSSSLKSALQDKKLLMSSFMDGKVIYLIILLI